MAAAYDVVVAGLGGMGSAVLAHCAARGARVLGIEQFDAEHDLGASSGKTRIIRKAYFESPAYVPLLLRAYDLWRELERSTGEELLHLGGLLLAGGQDSGVIRGALHAAHLHGLHVQLMSAAQVCARYPALRARRDEVAVFEPEAGALFPERAIRAHLRMARHHGAQMRLRTEMTGWTSDAGGVLVELSGGESVRARFLVLTLGPWFARAMREAGVTLQIQRNVQAWFTPDTGSYGAGSFPAFLVERDWLPAPLYGFPDFGDGVKAAFHGRGVLTTPGELSREIDPAGDIQPLADSLNDWMPGAAAHYREAKVCMYALTPDRHFVVGYHPGDARVILCGGFS